nr:MAG TPA: hypothetical protein [Caudoviricetes sp.]
MCECHTQNCKQIQYILIYLSFLSLVKSYC